MGLSPYGIRLEELSLPAVLDKQETLGKGIERIDHEGVNTGHMSGARHFGDDGVIGTAGCFRVDPAFKRCPENALDHAPFSDSEFVPRPQDCQPATHAGSGGASIHFSVSEDTDMAAVMMLSLIHI